MRHSNGTGKGGKSFQDRELAARVRTLALERIYEVLNGKDTQLRKTVILKLATTILPRLNEYSGPDRQPIPIMGGLSILNGAKNDEQK